MEVVAVAGAAAVVGRDHDVALLHGLAHEGPHAESPIGVHAAVHPHQRRMTGGILGERRKHVGRNLEAIGAALVRDLLEVHDALGPCFVCAVGSHARFDVAVTVGATPGQIGGVLAHEEGTGAGGVGDHDTAARRRGVLRMSRRERRQCSEQCQR